MLRSTLRYFLFLLLFSSSAKARSVYNDLIDEAWNKYEKKEFLTSAQLYEKAFSLDSNSYSDDHYNAACSWALAGNDSNAIVNLNRAIDKGFSDMERMKNDPDLKKLLQEPLLSNLIKKKNAIKEEERQYTIKSTPTYYWGMYLGILFVFFFYNLFLFFSLKDVTFLYYSVSIFFLSQLYTVVIHPFGIYSKELFFWVKYIPWNSNASFIVANLMVIFHLLFISKFLNLKEIAPKLFKINRWVLIYLSFLSILLLGPRFFDKPFFISLIATYIFSLYAGIVCWRKGYRPAKFLTIASIFLTIGVTMMLLNNVASLGLNLTLLGVYRSDNLAFIIFYGLLSFALGDKINHLKQEKLQAQEKALEVLEEKVKERTSEVVKQKEIIEEKNKDITDSILYARRIQQSLLPTMKYIDKNLKRLLKK